MANLCCVCGRKTSLFTQTEIRGGYVCGDCQKKSLKMSNCNCRTAQDYLNRFAYLEENQKLSAIYVPTIRIFKFLEVDENNRLFRIGKSPEYFPFSYLINFELIEDGSTVAKGGLGRAAVGGVLFGGAGAVVGGVTGKKSKSIIQSVYIRITLNDPWVKSTTIELIRGGALDKRSPLYHSIKSAADQLVSALEIIVENQKQAATATAATARPQLIEANSPADEILKYKRLLDMGAITEDEFSQKKMQLLGI